MEDRHPLLVCLEKPAGEEVVLRVEPDDDFLTFLQRAKSVLGYDIDISSVTKDKPYQMHENVYQFLVNLEITDPNMVQTYDPDMVHTYDPSIIQAYDINMACDSSLVQTYSSDLQTHDPNLMQTNDSTGQSTDIQLDNDQLYVLDDGTQIRASQIYFDNEDSFLDLSLENIPFIKINDDVEEAKGEDFEQVTHKIIASPIPITDSSPKHGFINHVPFKLVCNNTTSFEAQFTRYLEATTKTYATLSTVTKKNKSPRSLIRDNFNDKEEFRYTRDEILNMLKDSPVTSIPYEISDKKHVRKMDPTKMVQKAASKAINIDGLVVGDGGNRDCVICGKNVSDDKIYIFNNEDQKIHKCSPQKKTSTQLKIICEHCLNHNLKPSRMKSATQFLNTEEYLVIRNNQQYIFQKTKNFKFRTESENVKKEEFVKFEIGSDGEIVTKPVDDDVIMVHDGRKDSDSDVEIIETDLEVDKIIDNVEESDEDVKVFLGKYECGNTETIELKCRFCLRVFPAVSEVIEHGEAHKHVLEDDIVFPCPLCEYGYASLKWLKGHLLAAHDKKVKTNDLALDEDCLASITTQIRSSSFIEKDVNTSGDGKDSICNDSNVNIIIKTEVKQEAISSDDEIWIVQNGDDQHHLDQILEAADGDSKGDTFKKCQNCGVVFTSSQVMSAHKCARGNTKRTELTVTNDEDFLRRAQEKPMATSTTKSNQRQSKTKKEPTESQIVICNNCNQSFTSKVRLKFHMQFHESTSMLMDGQYRCCYCGDSFSGETRLFDHVHFAHQNTKRWQCPVRECGKTFSLRATLTKHGRTHTDTRRYVCVTCGKRFLDKQTLDEHGVTHLQIKPYQCHICLKQLTRVSRLRMHVRSHEEELAPTLLLVCRICSRAFRDNQEAQEHACKSAECFETIASKLKTEEESIQLLLSPSSGVMHQTTQIIDSPEARISRQVASPLAAPLLSKLSDEAASLIRVVEVEKVFRCEYCEDVFYTEEGLNSHRAAHKGVKKPFTCHVCKVSFATYSRCTTHKTTHGFYKRASSTEAATVVGYNDFPTVKHFLCEDCGRSYLHWTYLQVHRRMKHPDGNHLHNCNQCDMTFPNSWSLSYHRKKNHTKVTQEETTKSDLVQTFRTNRIPCRDCDEILPNKTALYRHRNKEHHIGVSVQNWTTGMTGSSQRQKLVSVGPRARARAWCARAWSCVRCPRRYRTRAELRAHARTAHPRHLAVIEMQGRSVTSEEALRIIKRNNINPDRVIEVSVMTFEKGSTSIVPNTARALAILGNVPRATLNIQDWSPTPAPGTVMEYQSGHMLSKNPWTNPSSESQPDACSTRVLERNDL